MKAIKNIVIFCLLGFFLAASFVLAQPSGIPNVWKGTVQIDGSPALDGTIITAHINGSDTINSNALVGSGNYLIKVSCNNGEDVSFKVYGIWVNGTSEVCAGSGELHYLNITINTLSESASCEYSEACNSGYCVHTVCRNSSVYCGDGHCDSGESYSSCSADCPPPSSPSSPGGGAIAGGGLPPTTTTTTTTTVLPATTTTLPPCVESWSCTDWSDCVNGIQTRTCTDANDCGTVVNKPAESQDCTVPTAPTGFGALTGMATAFIGNPIYLSISLLIVIAVMLLILKKMKYKLIVEKRHKSKE